MDKSSLRQEYIGKRKALEAIDLAQKMAAVSANVGKYLKDKQFSILHTFLPQRNSGEVDTWPIIDMVRREYPSVSIASPYIIPGTREMEHYLISAETSLIENQWRIPEPDPLTSQKIDPEQIDAIFVPLLAFDPVEKIVDKDQYDVPLDICITPTTIHNF